MNPRTSCGALGAPQRLRSPTSGELPNRSFTLFGAFGARRGLQGDPRSWHGHLCDPKCLSLSNGGQTSIELSLGVSPPLILGTSNS
jgi:hypothetical protein